MCSRSGEFSEIDKLSIWEQTDIENNAGAVVWDAALVLAHYLYLITRIDPGKCSRLRKQLNVASRA